MKTLLMSTGTAAATHGSAAAGSLANGTRFALKDAGLSDAARALSSRVVDNALQYWICGAFRPKMNVRPTSSLPRPHRPVSFRRARVGPHQQSFSLIAHLARAGSVRACLPSFSVTARRVRARSAVIGRQQ